MFASLKKTNHISYLRRGLTLRDAYLVPLWSLCFTSLHFLSFHSPLSNGNNWFFFFCSHFCKWKTLVIKHFVSKSEFQDRHRDWRKIGNSLKLKRKKEVAKMWKEEAGNEIMNGVQVSYLSQAERHKGCKLSATRNELPICEKSDCSILFDLALLSSLKKMSALLLLLLWAFINP